MTSSAPPAIRLTRSDDLPYVGRHGDGGQFVMYTLTLAQDGEQQLCAVLHRFDVDGHHVSTRLQRAGGPEDPGTQRRLGECQQRWLRDLATLLLGPVDARPFDIEVEGVRFRLLDRADGGRLEPLGLDFVGRSEP